MLGLRAKLAAKKLRHKYENLGTPKEATSQHPELHSPDACRVVQTAVKQALAAEVRAFSWSAVASQDTVQLLGVTPEVDHSTYLGQWKDLSGVKSKCARTG